MKIVCPECQAAYEIEIPESPTKDVSAKCAVCNSKFLVRKGSPAQTRPTHKTMSGPPLAQIDSTFNADSEDDFLFGLQEDLSELHSDPIDKSSEADKTLDDYLDKLLEEELEDPSQQADDKSLENPEETPAKFEMPSEEELDSLFDSIITEEMATDDPPEISTSQNAEPDLKEEDLDALFDDIIKSDMDSNEPLEPASDVDGTKAVSSSPDLLFEENEEIAQDFSDSLSEEPPPVNETEPFDATIPAIYPAELTDKKDLWEDHAGDENNSNPDELEKDLENDSSTSPAEASDPELAAPDPEIQEGAVEVQAKTIADQEATESEATATDEKKEETVDDTPATDDKKEETLQEPEEEKSDDDLWAEAFADQEATESEATATDEKKEETVDDTPATDDKKEETLQEPEEEKSDDDLWAETSPNQEENPEESSAPEAESNTNEEFGDENAIPELEYDSEEELDIEEDGPYADYEDDEEDDPLTTKKKSGVFSLPATLVGKVILGGGILAVLLTGGGMYFALQTLAPPELTQMGKTQSAIPEDLKPNPAGDNPADQQNAPENATSTANLQTPESTSAPISAASPEKAPDITQDLAKAGNSLDVAVKPDISEGLLTSFVPSNHAVELSAIMPVAYNVNDIRILSFSLEAEMSDEESAQVVREALPVFEKITLATVEKLLAKKFFNDILYVQEKLKKNLQANFNKTLEGGGRVKKINFKEFTVQ